MQTLLHHLVILVDGMGQGGTESLPKNTKKYTSTVGVLVIMIMAICSVVHTYVKNSLIVHFKLGYL